MSVTRILSVIALLLAVASLIFTGYPLLVVAVILLSIAEIIRG